jgi:soluble lytic murein transglycosylase-like protein
MNKNKLQNYIMLIFNVAINVSLSIHAGNALAVSTTSKEQNQHHATAYIRGKISNNYDDVWERIRLGMKITGPSLIPLPSKQTLIPEKNNPKNTTPEQPVKSKYIVQPHTAIAPLNNYTALGFRLKFGTASPTSSHDNCNPVITMQAPQEQTANNPTPCAKHIDRLNTPAKQHDVVEQNNTKKAMINERINKHIAFFSENPGYLYRVTERAHPYLYHIVEALSKNQLPLELALLPMVESAYQPTALSPKGAAGLWQFIPSTGKDYDLKQSNQYDERLDILASTQAAIRFLSDLKNHFNGDWLLALAAYNCGQGAIDNAISRNLSDGLDTDFWSLRLPEETQEYVPRLLALSHIFANPALYGLKFAPIKNEPYFVKVKIDRAVDIKYLANKNFALLAKLVNLTHEQFKCLNPGYLNPTLSTKKEYTFLLPLANVDQLHRLLTSITQFMAEPVSQTMKKALKTNPPTLIDLNESILTSIRL